MLVRATGYNWPSTIYYDTFADIVKGHLTDNLIGTNYVQLSQGSNRLTGYYELLIDVQTSPNDSPDRVKSVLYQVLSGDLNTLGIDILSSSNIPSTNQANNDVNNIIKQFTDSAGYGIGTGTILVGAAILLVLLLRK